MKIYFLSTLIVLLQLSISNVAIGQVQTPQLSPVCEVNQTVGLTEINISYSRPSKRNRVVFGEVVPYNEMWRLGANKNSMITISEEIYFKQDTLPKGTYALFAKPSEDKWELVFYSEYSNVVDYIKNQNSDFEGALDNSFDFRTDSLTDDQFLEILSILLQGQKDKIVDKYKDFTTDEIASKIDEILVDFIHNSDLLLNVFIFLI